MSLDKGVDEKGVDGNGAYENEIVRSRSVKVSTPERDLRKRVSGNCGKMFLCNFVIVIVIDFTIELCVKMKKTHNGFIETIAE